MAVNSNMEDEKSVSIQERSVSSTNTKLRSIIKIESLVLEKKKKKKERD